MDFLQVGIAAQFEYELLQDALLRTRQTWYMSHHLCVSFNSHARGPQNIFVIEVLRSLLGAQNAELITLNYEGEAGCGKRPTRYTRCGRRPTLGNPLWGEVE